MLAINIISDVNKLCRGFGLEWNFVSSKNGGKYLVTVLVVEYLMLILASGNHPLLRVVVVGVFALKL